MPPLGAHLRLGGSGLPTADVAHLHALIGEWQLLADLSFADLLLHLPDTGGGFTCVAQVRPATGPTLYLDDVVGRSAPAGVSGPVATAWQEGRIVREGDPRWTDDVPVREEAIPVRHQGRLIAVLQKDTNLSVPRAPSPLELAYLQSSWDLAAMVAEGSFPFRDALPEPTTAPRVGDGLLRVGADGRVQFASPNGLSAYRRLGFTGNLGEALLTEVHAALGLVGEQRLDRSLAEGHVGRVLGRRLPSEAEVESRDGSVVVRLRCIPLLADGAAPGALVLVRDVTDLRRRDVALLSKDATIREIHHRVKNNLQTVAALLRLQARRTDVAEARLALQESVRRVTSIALVHETLSQTLDEQVDFDSIADDVAALTVDLAATGDKPTVRRVGSFGVLPAAVATPLALVISELVQNAVEHACAGGGGEVELRVTRGLRGLELVVADDGPGLPAGFALEHSGRLGLQIVRTLVVGEMRGTLAMRAGADGGTEAVLAIPEQAWD